MDIATAPVADLRAQRFAAVVHAWRCRSFAWGAADCVRFAAEVVQAVAGADPLRDLPAWANRRQALRLLRQLGGLQHAVAARLGPGCPAAMARLADIVLASDPFAPGPRPRTLLAVCNGATLLAPSAAGLAPLPLAAGLWCWPLDRSRHG